MRAEMQKTVFENWCSPSVYYLHKYDEYIFLKSNCDTKLLEYPFKCYNRMITTNTILDFMSVRVRLLKQPSKKYMKPETCSFNYCNITMSASQVN